MRHVEQENLCENTDKIQLLYSELNSTLDLYYEKSIESELCSQDN